VPARGVDLKSATARGPIEQGIRFAPQTIASSDLPQINLEGKPMTAYLISLALVGLIAIAACEVFV
jgi:hypothetical protein